MDGGLIMIPKLFLSTHKQLTTMKKIILNLIVFLVAFATLKSQYVMPSGGEDGYDWRVGTTQAISWSKYFMDTTKNIDILLWDANTATFSTIATNIPVADEYYLWEIPLGLPIGNQFKIKIIYSNDFLPQFKYVSNDFFSIKAQAPPQQIPSPIQIVIKNNAPKIVNIFPNPTPDMVNIQCNDNFFCIETYDITGSLVLYKKFDYTNDYQLHTGELSSGVYTMKIRFMGSSVNEQLFIQR